MTQDTQHVPEQLPTRPGVQADMAEQPVTKPKAAVEGQKLAGKVAIITGGDSGIGQAVAAAFARQGADIAIIYLEEGEDAEQTCKLVEGYGRKALPIAGDVGDEAFCQAAVAKTVEQFGRIDILINNAAEQHPQDSIMDISADQLERTFRTNIFGMFYMVKASLPHMQKGSSIINTSSVTAYKGSPQLLDYSSTKGAITAFTRSLSMALADQGIRVNAVAPGPIWTPLIPSTFPPDKVEQFGADVPMGRSGQPDEVAPAYVFLASDDGSYISGQTLHVNGGTVVNS